MEPNEPNDEDPEREVVSREWTGPRPTGPQIEAALLSHLRRKLATPGLKYARRPTHLGEGVSSRAFAFRLSGAKDKAWSQPLVLRMTLRDIQGQEGRELEQALRNALAKAGAPVPRVLLRGDSEAKLGASYTIEERAEGRDGYAVLGLSLLVTMGLSALTPLDYVWLGPLLACWGVLAVTLVRLHAVPVAALESELERAGVDPARMGMVASLRQMQTVIDRLDLDELRPVVAWLREHWSREDETFVICHGDFHPGNLIVSARGRIGLIDWGAARVAGREYDLAWMMILPYIGLAQFGVQLPVWLTEPLSWLLRTFLWIALVPAVGLYRLLRRVDRQRLRVYGVQRSLQRLITTARFRLQARESGVVAPANFFETATSIALLRRRIRRVTGLRVAFPLRPEDVP